MKSATCFCFTGWSGTDCSTSLALNYTEIATNGIVKSYFNCSKLTTQQRSDFSPVCLSEDQIKDFMAGKSVSFAESQLLFRLTLLMTLLVGLQLLLSL